MSQRKSVVPVVPIKSQSSSESDVLDAREACRYLKISLRTLRRYVKEGRITFLRYSAQAQRFRKVDLDAFMESVLVKAA
jgi:excisionase family DNA binding protein